VEEAAVRRFSIAKLMGFVGVIALGIAALRAASDLWVGIVVLVTAALLGFAMIGIAYRREGKRAWWFGFALFGWGYWVMAAGPWFAKEIGARLPTSQFLMFLHSKVQPQTQAGYADLSLSLTGQSGLMTSSGTMMLQPGIPGGPGSGLIPGMAGGASAPLTFTTTPGANTAPQPGSFVVNFLFATSGNQDHFLRIGHCLFSLIAAFLGGLIAMRMEKSRCPRQSAL
jgi:hypothetical protein